MRGADGVRDDVEPSAIPSTATDEPIASEIPAGDGLENSPGSDDGCRVTSGWWRGRDHRNDRYVERE
ncbi:hypothetical protein C484_21813 [Natrialba taiwanensis DSM 12281]|uniref:Uncharacterized protein n=1 Tax=Natrialba taiwanensis DSM 12281 TaxID=1230458 RepID=L9ZI36_9EURY|nr:hypothetical protein C484_21813 [Natrialba taiwanensis DSM 12281]